jgi:hypothetical protein
MWRIPEKDVDAMAAERERNRADKDAQPAA